MDGRNGNKFPETVDGALAERLDTRSSDHRDGSVDHICTGPVSEATACT